MSKKNKVGRGLILFFFCAVLIAAVFPFHSFSEDGITIVSVNLNKVLEIHPAFQQAQAEYQSELQKVQQELQTMNEEEKAARQGQLEQQIQELGARLQNEAAEEMHDDIEKIAQEKGYDYVIDSSVLISGDLDITEEVIKELE